MKPTLLIAESDAELRDAYRALLTASGYDVVTAADGLDCLENLRRLAPAVCVLDRDLRWGGADGVLAWLREEGATSAVSVVLTATAGHPEDGAVDTEPPVIRLLPKPFGLAALLESVQGLMARMGNGESFPLDGDSASPEVFIG
jgi:DNA-binding response OmpR family regulator